MTLDQCPLIECAKELVAGEVETKKTKYYKFLMGELEREGTVWGWIKDENNVIKRVEKFKKLAQSIMLNGYNMELISFKIVENNLYGAITAYWSNGLTLVDGHHRASVLMALGHKTLPVIIFEQK
jgi:hypothetical protein